MWRCSSMRSWSRSATARPPSRPAYAAIGVTVDGTRDVLGLWMGTGGQGAKFWLQVLTEITNRGTEDVCIVVCDGLTGLPDAIGATWPLAVVQTCVLYLIRNTFRLASRKDWDAMARDLRPVYTAVNEQAAKERLGEFHAHLGREVSGDRPAVGQRVGRVRAVPGLQPRDQKGDLLHERDREPACPVPPRHQSQRAFPQRAGGAEVPLSCRPEPGPDRQGTATLDEPLEARAERLRDHLRRPHLPQRRQATPMSFTPNA